MQKLLDTLSRAEGLVDGAKGPDTETQPWKRVSRLANECSQIRYLLQKVDAEGCALAAAVQPVRFSHIPSLLSILY